MTLRTDLTDSTAQGGSVHSGQHNEVNTNVLGLIAGSQAVDALNVAGLTGSTAGGRFVGFTSSGAPASGAHLANDYCFDVGNVCFHFCTASGTPGTWVRVGTAGQELGYAESTTLSLSTTTSLQDLSGLTTTVTVGTRPIEVHGYVPVSTVGAAGRSRLGVIESTTTLQLADTGQTGSSTTSGTLNVWARLAPSAGSHTYKLQGACVTASSGTMSSGSTFPAFIRVVEL